MVTMLIAIINDFKKSYKIIQERIALLEKLKNYFCKRIRKRDVGWGRQLSDCHIGIKA